MFEKRISSPQEVEPLLTKLVDANGSRVAYNDGGVLVVVDPTEFQLDRDAISEETAFRLRRSIKSDERWVSNNRVTTVSRVSPGYIFGEHTDGYVANVPTTRKIRTNKGEYFGPTELRFYTDIPLGLDDPEAFVAARAIYEVAAGRNRVGHRERLSKIINDNEAGWQAAHTPEALAQQEKDDEETFETMKRMAESGIDFSRLDEPEMMERYVSFLTNMTMQNDIDPDAVYVQVRDGKAVYTKNGEVIDPKSFTS